MQPLIMVDIASLPVPGGRALYPSLALVRHSCLPNCVFIPGTDLTGLLRAKRRIEEGEEITVNYTGSPLPGLPVRKVSQTVSDVITIFVAIQMNEGIK